MTNPLLADWDTPFGIPPFARVDDAHFRPALDAALTEARSEIERIAQDPAPPSFDNTIAALELADARLKKVLGVFFNLASTDLNEMRRGLQREFSPLLSAYSSDIVENAALFRRIETLWENRDRLGLTPEQERVLMLTRRSFLRAGAALGADSKARLRAIMTRLSMLGTEFTQNVLADEEAWALPLTEANLEGLPDFVVDDARAAGAARGLDAPAITLSRSLIVPFLQFSLRRDLREKAWRAWVNRGLNGGDTDNTEIAAEVLRLRQERAELLGYENFAAFKLETQMAGEPAAVRDLLMQVWKPARAAAVEDAAALEDMLRADGVNDALAPWDWRHYSDRRRQALHDLDEAAIKPYFQRDRMIEAAFACAHRLFGLEFAEIQASLHHSDARAWEVTRHGRHMGVFIADHFARRGKRSGAWCSTIRGQRKLDGDVRPIVLNVCNFAQPPAGEPALLSHDDARTLFHEFGHALHQLLSDVTYPSIAGTSVARDFVELPSQLFEHWLESPEVLGEFATHAKSGAPMPVDLRERLQAAATHDVGFQTVEYIASALVDLSFHDGPAPADPMAKQAEVLEDIGMPPAIVMRHATPHFAHVFAGDGYSSGYYSYMWSEVMDADAFDAFREAGDIFDSDLAARLERHILSAGGSDEAAALYMAFRGRMPGVEALLKGRGLAA